MQVDSIDVPNVEQGSKGETLAAALVARLSDMGEAPAVRHGDTYLTAHAFLEQGRACAEVLRIAELTPGCCVLIDLPRSADLAVLVGRHNPTALL